MRVPLLSFGLCLLLVTGCSGGNSSPGTSGSSSSSGSNSGTSGTSGSGTSGSGSTGTGSTGSGSTGSGSSGSGSTSVSLKGSVKSGTTGVKNATVNLYAVGTSGYGAGSTLLATTTTASDGSFAFASNAYTCPYSNTPTYVIATGGDAGAGTNPDLALMAGLGECSSTQTANVTVNEVTTAASVFALAQFMSPTVGAGVTTAIGGPAAGSGTYTKGLVAAMNNTLPALVDVSTGTAKTSSTANGVTITTEAAKLNSIADALVSCDNSTGETSDTDLTTNCGVLFGATLPSGASVRAANTLQATLLMALQPWQNVSQVYNLASAHAVFAGLSAAPHDWSVAVSYKDSGLGVGISGTNPRSSMNLDIDATGRIWFTSTMSSAHGIAYFDPASASFNGPYATNLTHPQYVAIDANGTAWATDSASNQLSGVSTTSPQSVTTLTLSGATSLGPVLVDTQNLVVATYTDGTQLGLAKTDAGHTKLTAYNVILPQAAVATGLADTSSGDEGASLSTASSACFLYNDNKGSWAQQAASGSTCLSGGATPAALYASGNYIRNFTVTTASSSGQLCTDSSNTCFAPAVGLNAPEGVIVDGNSDLWVANSGDGSVSTLHGLSSSSAAASYTSFSQTATTPYLHDSTHGATLTTPYAIGVDASGNVWTISPGCVDSSSTACTPSGMVLTEMIGVAAPTITPLQAADTARLGTKPQS